MLKNRPISIVYQNFPDDKGFFYYGHKKKYNQVKISIAYCKYL